MVGPEIDPLSTEEEACQMAFYAKLINEPFITISQDERII